MAAGLIGLKTRIPSLELSSTGGTGSPGHSHTLSFTQQGIPLPAERQTPDTVFARLFLRDDPRSRQKRQERIADDKSILDAVLSQANRLHRELSKPDQEKLDEYLTSVREVEKRVYRAEHWMSIPKATVETKNLASECHTE